MQRLSEAQLLRGVDDLSLELVGSAGEILAVPAGERVIEEGAVPQRLLVVLSGSLEVYVPDPADRSRGRRLATLKRGESCGEYGFIDRRPASAGVKAAADCELFSISNDAFNDLLHRSPELERIVYRNLLRTLVDRLRASNVVIDMLRTPGG
ncbi:MAG TPA: cyclic nucleotide-binding domain-containing protein [Arenicellales bacterium]|nr:cyclic nucleotide-binding domain-containing protein [Arenicellales bacterium]